MAGIALPVLLHLWNDKQGKVLPIGSIAFLEKGSRRQARSRKLSEWWLLLLRCGLLLLLALLLSGPFWRKAAMRTKTKGWILGVGEDGPGQAYKPLIDSLLKAGYERHEFTRRPARNEPLSALRPQSYWDLFRAADREAPAGISFYIFTRGLRSGFTGKRPVSDRIVHWFTYTTSTNSATHWIGRAWFCSPDSIWALTGSSRPTGNSYSYQLLPAKTGAGPGGRDRPAGEGGYHVGPTNGLLSVALDSQPPVIVDTAPLRIQISVDNKYNNDSRYLVAALYALQSFTRQNIQVNVNDSLAGQMSHAAPDRHSNEVPLPDWIFWLSSTPVPADLPAHNILYYEPGREIPVDTWMQGITGVAVSRRVEPDSVKRAVSQSPPAYPVLWKDGFGQPLLALEISSGRRIFHFFSHFDPAWNGLVWSSRFPGLLQDLLANPASFAGSDPRETPSAESRSLASAVGYDLRVLDPEQIAPQKKSPGDHSSGDAAGLPGGSAHSAESGTPLHATDLAPACWILILILFVAERQLSFRSLKMKSYG